MSVRPTEELRRPLERISPARCDCYGQALGDYQSAPQFGCYRFVWMDGHAGINGRGVIWGGGGHDGGRAGGAGGVHRFSDAG